MLGAIAGDIIGSVYENSPIKSKDFPLFGPRSTFTDDSILTVATADALLNKRQYKDMFLKYGKLYPNAGYGGMFATWLRSENPEPYNSFGNGSSMRVSPIGFAFDDLDKVLEEARKSAEVTHNHPEGIKGAQATAASVFLAKGCDKKSIRKYIERNFGYDLSRPLDKIKEWYTFDVTCKETVPPAITAFLESHNFEDAVRNAVSLGGDSDTIACITGGIAEAFYGIPDEIEKETRQRLDKRLLDVVDRFRESYL